MIRKKIGEFCQFGKVLIGSEKEVMNFEQIVIDKGGNYGLV
jgi:hypothetical protein